MGTGKSLNGREKNSGEENQETREDPFRLFPVPTNCSWVSKNELRVDVNEKFLVLIKTFEYKYYSPQVLENCIARK